MLPEPGHRNTVVTLGVIIIAALIYIARGFATGDWAGFEWLMGLLGVSKAASALRARGEYGRDARKAEADATRTAALAAVYEEE